MAIVEEREANLPPFVFLYYLKSVSGQAHGDQGSATTGCDPWRGGPSQPNAVVAGIRVAVYKLSCEN